VTNGWAADGVAVIAFFEDKKLADINVGFLKVEEILD
jgi:hypothetical protein